MSHWLISPRISAMQTSLQVKIRFRHATGMSHLGPRASLCSVLVRWIELTGGQLLLA